MYTVTDLGTLGPLLGTESNESYATGINASGQVVGFASYNVITNTDTIQNIDRSFRTAPNSPINPATDDLGTLGTSSWDFTIAEAINDSGQVVGYSSIGGPGAGVSSFYAFRTAPNRLINPATDNLGGIESEGIGINASGEVVGATRISIYVYGAFRTTSNGGITDYLGTLGRDVLDYTAVALGINASGQVVGYSMTTTGNTHAFRTAPNSYINSDTDDLGTLGGDESDARAINDVGQVVGASGTSDSMFVHAYRTAPNSPINPATDDLGILGLGLPAGQFSSADAINAFGEVVGTSSANVASGFHAFIYSTNAMTDLNSLLPSDSAWELVSASGINNAGQIVGGGSHNGQLRAYRLDPIYKAIVQPPINADGSSVFNANRGVLPVKFTLTQNNTPTCTLPAATIAVTKAAGGTPIAIDESDPDFRITGCQYHYNLATGSLGVGTYRVDISINGIMVGHAVFALQ